MNGLWDLCNIGHLSVLRDLIMILIAFCVQVTLVIYVIYAIYAILVIYVMYVIYVRYVIWVILVNHEI